jgi:hypothetical protein
MNTPHKGKLNGGEECAVSSEYAQITTAIENPTAARTNVSLRRFRLSIAVSMVRRGSVYGINWKGNPPPGFKLGPSGIVPVPFPHAHAGSV